MTKINENINVIEKYFGNNESMMLYYNMDYDGELIDFLDNYNYTKHDKIFNSKVFIILSLKLKKQLEEEYNICYKCFINDLKNKNISVKELTDEYIQKRYNQLINNDKHYKLINKIKKRYRIPIQNKIVITDNS